MPKSTNPVKVIREKCLDCCCGSMKQVELCPARATASCGRSVSGRIPLGKSPNGTEEQMARLTAAKRKKSGAINEEETNETGGVR